MEKKDISSGSVGILFNQLVARLEPDLVDRDARHQHLKRKLYETLFRKQNGPLNNRFTLDEEGEERKETSKERLLQVVFELRRKRRFDQGHQLEKLIARLPDLENAQNSELKAVLDVLLAFAGSKPHAVQTLGYKLPDLPINVAKSDIVELPHGDLYHGDSKYLYKQDGHNRYVHYSRDLFEGPDSSPLDGVRGVESAKAYNMDYQVFSAEPGKDLHGKGLFNVKVRRR